MPIGKRAAAEFFGTFWLVFGGCGAAVLAAGVPNVGIGYAGVALAFGLTVLTMAFAIGHISGCHLNPAVSVGLVVGKRFPASELLPYVVAQVVGAIVGVWIAHLMFDEALWQLSTKVRAGPSQWFSEFVAAFGLVLTILLTLRAQPSAVAALVGLYITAAYWFTASTSFANPAVIPTPVDSFTLVCLPAGVATSGRGCWR